MNTTTHPLIAKRKSLRNQLQPWLYKAWERAQETGDPITAAQQPLANKVLCVASVRVEGWCAYCGVVEGKDHSAEALGIHARGTKLQERIALAVFPAFAGMPYAE